LNSSQTVTSVLEGHTPGSKQQCN